MDKKNLCFYHNADLDGLCSAAIVKKFVPDTEFYGINYGDEFPYDLCKLFERIIMVDWTLQPFNELLKFGKSHKLTVIDHHKSVAEELRKCPNHNFIGIIDSKKAACELCWEYFSNDDMPRAVKLLGQYDSWRLNEDEWIMPFQFGMRANVDSFDDPIWGRLFRLFDESKTILFNIVSIGKGILSYNEIQNKKYCELYAYPARFHGYSCWACNKGQNNSQFFDSLPEHDISISYCHTPDKVKQWTISLYSNTVDVSEIAKTYGGGGHAGASGFQCNELPFTKK